MNIDHFRQSGLWRDRSHCHPVDVAVTSSAFLGRMTRRSSTSAITAAYKARDPFRRGAISDPARPMNGDRPVAMMVCAELSGAQGTPRPPSTPDTAGRRTSSSLFRAQSCAPHTEGRACELLRRAPPKPPAALTWLRDAGHFRTTSAVWQGLGRNPSPMVRAGPDSTTRA
jgi:hypothetical protein